LLDGTAYMLYVFGALEHVFWFNFTCLGAQNTNRTNSGPLNGVPVRSSLL